MRSLASAFSFQQVLFSKRSNAFNDFFLIPDENECVTQRPCSHGCTNVMGSFMCGCPDGFMIGSDGRECEGKCENLNEKFPRERINKLKCRHMRLKKKVLTLFSAQMLMNASLRSTSARLHLNASIRSDLTSAVSDAAKD